MFTLNYKMAFNFILFLAISKTAYAEQSCSSNLERSNSLIQFQDNGDGTISDQKTHLMWQKCVVGQTGTECYGEPEQLTWIDAFNKAAALNSTGSTTYNDWRMPNIKELSTLIERSCLYPSIDLTAFPNTESNQKLWSSTTLVGNPSYVINIAFTNGTIESSSKGSTRPLRLVRNF